MGDFGRARGLTFVPVRRHAPHPDRPIGLPSDTASALALAIEGELEQARTALAALEEASAGARLTRIERQLLAHPHLPQAAFLMGECLALQAQAAREHSPALALALEARRTALEGPRAAAFGAPLTALTAESPLSVAVRGLDREDELELDAEIPGPARQVQLLPGLHHARVWRRGRPIFATFVALAPEQRALELDVPPLTPCSEEDLEGASSSPGASSPSVSPRIACQRWAKVREEPGGIGVALCEHQRCGAFVHWERRASEPFTPIPVDRARGLPAWATFTIAGAAAVVATSVVLWQAGAFERGRPSAAAWEYGGLNPQGLRF